MTTALGQDRPRWRQCEVRYLRKRKSINNADRADRVDQNKLDYNPKMETFRSSFDDFEYSFRRDFQGGPFSIIFVCGEREASRILCAVGTIIASKNGRTKNNEKSVEIMSRSHTKLVNLPCMVMV